MSKPRLILHIGSPRTGTTALQTCMAKNQKFLMDNKICYSDFYEPENYHVNLTISLIHEYFEKNNCDITPTYVLENMYSQYPINIINNMKRVFYENNCKTLILSDEHIFEGTIWWIFSSSGNTEDLLRGRRDYIRRYFKEAFKEFDIKIVCYLRRQDDYVESYYNQFCKSVNNMNYIDVLQKHYLSLKMNAYDYNASVDDMFDVKNANIVDGMLDINYAQNLSEWSAIYGKENIIVRIYEKSHLPKGIEYDFFTNILGFDNELIEKLELYKNINASSKHDIIEYMVSARLFDMQSEFNELNESPALAHLNKCKTNVLSAKRAKEILDYCEEDNSKIAREYLGREDGILFYDKRREEKDDYPGLSLQAALDISRELIFILKNKEYTKKEKFFAQLFWDSGEGYSEKNSLTAVVRNMENIESETTEFIFPLYGARIGSLRFDPLDGSCVLLMEEAVAIYENGQSNELQMIGSNAFYNDFDKHSFPTDDPQILFTANSGESIREIKIKVRFLVVDDMQRVMADIFAKFCELNLQRHEFEARYNEFEIQRNDLQMQYSEIVSSTSWKITAPIRALQRLFKKK